MSNFQIETLLRHDSGHDYTGQQVAQEDLDTWVMKLPTLQRRLEVGRVCAILALWYPLLVTKHGSSQWIEPCFVVSAATSGDFLPRWMTSFSNGFEYLGKETWRIVTGPCKRSPLNCSLVLSTSFCGASGTIWELIRALRNSNYKVRDTYLPSKNWQANSWDTWNGIITMWCT